MNDKRILRDDDSHRIVITGMGALTPLGHSVEETWEGAEEAAAHGVYQSIGRYRYTGSIIGRLT
jgi:3-oxoacyl-(acyl-carrier-protein) synthase